MKKTQVLVAILLLSSVSMFTVPAYPMSGSTVIRAWEKAESCSSEKTSVIARLRAKAAKMSMNLSSSKAVKIAWRDSYNAWINSANLDTFKERMMLIQEKDVSYVDRAIIAEQNAARSWQISWALEERAWSLDHSVWVQQTRKLHPTWFSVTALINPIKNSNKH